MPRNILVAIFTVMLFAQAASAQATQPADNAAPLYLRAAKLVVHNYDANIMSPSASNLTYPPYPPFPDEWQKMEQANFPANAEARALAHKARSLSHANWPPHNGPDAGTYLNSCRALANELGDAALYQHVQGQDAEAFETIQDMLHFAELLDDQPDETYIRYLVSIGIQALAMDRLSVIASGATITSDPANTNDVQLTVPRELMQRLSAKIDVQSKLAGIEKEEGSGHAMAKPDRDKLIEAATRVNTDVGLAAMSLACHVYRAQNGHWPASLEELRSVLPKPPIDAYGDGKQSLGYTLIKTGLPDGSDRPLVYSRYHATGGLFYRVDRPNYSFYNDDGSNRPIRQQKSGGQFRDVTHWNPGHAPAATTQPLN